MIIEKNYKFVKKNTIKRSLNETSMHTSFIRGHLKVGYFNCDFSLNVTFGFYATKKKKEIVRIEHF